QPPSHRPDATPPRRRGPGPVARPEPGDHQADDAEDRHHDHNGPPVLVSHLWRLTIQSFLAPTSGVGPPLSVVAGGGALARLQDEDAPAEQQQADREEVEAEQPQRGPGDGQQRQPPSQRPDEAPPRTAAPAA